MHEDAEVMKALGEGMFLSSETAQELERRLSAAPDDLDTRARLLGYYTHPNNRSDISRHARNEHLLWFIRCYPGSSVHESAAYALVDDDGNEQREAACLWRENVLAHPQDARVLGHAGRFFLHAGRFFLDNVREVWLDPEDLIQRAEALDPENCEWPQQLGLLYEWRMRWHSGQERADAARKALIHYERAYQLTKGEEDHILLLDNLSKTAFEGGELTKSRTYAEQLLSGAPVCAQGTHVWNPGNALFHGNLILGRIALEEGNVEVAKARLLEAGRTPGSPQLNSFGPDMALARDLLKRGERETVLEFLKLCANFWVCGQSELRKWVGKVRNGDEPDFSGNIW